MKSPNEFGLKAAIKKKRKAKMDFSAQRGENEENGRDYFFWNMQMPIFF